MAKTLSGEDAVLFVQELAVLVRRMVTERNLRCAKYHRATVPYGGCDCWACTWAREAVAVLSKAGLS